MYANAIIFEEPGKLSLEQVELVDPGADDLIVEVEWSGISTGTEKLLWTGQMPPFPGLQYPLVPGYETVGVVVDAPPMHAKRIGQRVYVPGSAGYKDVRGLFGGSASVIVVPASKAVAVDADLGRDAVLMALAATAHHALGAKDARLPEVIVGHGILGRLLARLTLALGGSAPVIWETNEKRRSGSYPYNVVAPPANSAGPFQTIYDVSGASGILDQLLPHAGRAGEIVLAGFYTGRVDFTFPLAFMKEARIRIAAEWDDADMLAIRRLLDRGRLSFSGLVTHEARSVDAEQAYQQAFNDPECLKMVLNWSDA